MLSITSNTRLLKMAISEMTVDATQVKMLHETLIDVTSRCLSLLSPESSLSCDSQEISLLEHSLDLAKRAHDLELPLHLPLHQSLCTALVQHEYYHDEPLDIILEIANMAVSSLHTTLQSSFFADSLITLIRYGFFSSALSLCKVMKKRFDIPLVGMSTCVRALGAINVQLADSLLEAESAKELLMLFEYDRKAGQSFSTFSSTTGDQTAPAVVSETPSEALQAASSQAQQVRSTLSKPTLNDSQEIIEAARAILTITSNTRLLKMAISETTADAAQVKTLHQTFIDVTSRCLSRPVPPSNEPLLYIMHSSWQLVLMNWNYPCIFHSISRSVRDLLNTEPLFALWKLPKWPSHHSTLL